MLHVARIIIIIIIITIVIIMHHVGGCTQTLPDHAVGGSTQTLPDHAVAWLLRLPACLPACLQVYIAALSLYADPIFRGPPLFHVVLDAHGADIKYIPSLDAISQRLRDTITQTVDAVNGIPGLLVRGGQCIHHL